MKKTFNSTCSYCGVGCGVTITRTDDGRLTLEGNPNTPASRGMLCSKGLNLHHVVSDHSDRILKPQMRYARHLPRHEVSWEDAIKRSAAVFKTLINKYGADSVGLYVSGQMLTEEYYLANKLCKGFLGTNNIDTNSRLCMSTAVASYKKALGEDAPPISYEDIEACSLFFIAGANPAWCHPIIFRRIEAHKAENPDVKIICVDPRRTQTAEMADLHLQIKPGTDIYLYNAIAALIFAKGYADQSFMEQHVDGFEELKAYLQSIDLHQAAQKCEIKYADIILAADMIGQSETLLTMWAMGLNQSSIGVNKNLALINLSLITGRIGKPGCGPFSLTGQGNAMGGREVGGMATMLAAHRNLDNPDHIREVADFWGVKTLSDRPGYSATEMVEALEDSRLKAVWIVCTNPAVSLPSSDRVDAAFKKAKFVMVSEISNRSDTLAYADVILPAAGWLEKEGVMTNSDRHLSYLPKVVDAPGEALPDSEIFIRFAREMGFGKQFSYRWPEDIFNEHRALTKGTNIDISGITYQRLKKNNIQWPCPDLNHPGSKRLFEDGRYWTASQNAQVFQIAPENTAESISKEYPFIITTGRIRDQWHTMTRTGKVNKLKQHIKRPFVEIHPDDAKRLHLRHGELAKVSSCRSSVLVEVQITDTIKPGCLFLPMHWGLILSSSKARANNLTSMNRDPLSKQPEFKFSAGRVEKIILPGKKIILVGAGAASLEFINAYRDKNKEDEIHVFAKEPLLFYNRVLLPEYINQEKQWQDIKSSEKAELERLNIVFHQGNAITKINRAEKTITDQHGKSHNYDKLILATGSRPMITMNIPRNMQGVFGLRTRSDADNIRAYLQHGGRALIIGGGLLGLELAGSLRSMGVDVSIIQRSSRLMRAQLDELGSQLLHEEIIERGINIIYNDEVSTISGADKLQSVTLNSGRKLKIDALFFAAGIKPNTELGEQCNLKFNRGLIVNDHMQSSDRDIFVIGEIAEHRKKTYGTTPAAQDQARVAADYLNGNIWSCYDHSLSFNILKIKDLQLCSLGITSKPSGDSYQEIILLDRQMRYYKKCILHHDRLIGAILIGDKSEFAEFKTLIEEQLELGDKRYQLLKGPGKPIEAPVGPIICSCNNVGAGNIEKYIADGCNDFDQLCRLSNAGTGCGSCRPEVKRILDLSGAVKS
ncbi:molybdopterin-dependent oxidoreductase [Psychromonas sp.]|uniref:molybdopterin-dependent oxidoreductase n=1 Tax=Psychromonas sp. TaxID=1884585 RepID=UPI00356A13EA